MNLVRVTQEDIALGSPLPWMVYDRDGNPLMDEGAVLDTEAQLQTLFARHPMRMLSSNSTATSPPSESREGVANALEAPLPKVPKSQFTFADMRLQPGDKIQLQPPSTVGQDRHFVKLIGYIDGVDLLVSAPLENGLPLSLRESDKVVARIFSNQKAFGFCCTVERVCKIPYDYLHLSFPVQIQGSIIRKSPRVRTDIETAIVKLGAGGSDDRQSGVIVNLSADGALLRTSQASVGKGQLIQLSFRVKLHGVDTSLTVGGVICSNSPDEDSTNGPMFNQGINFQNLALKDSVVLKSLIYQQMIEQPHTLT